jgi:hypothetical protein
MDRADAGSLATQLATATWRKSRYSNPNGACLEVAQLSHDLIAVRDSKVADGPAIVLDRLRWQALLARVRAGQLS